MPGEIDYRFTDQDGDRLRIESAGFGAALKPDQVAVTVITDEDDKFTTYVPAREMRDALNTYLGEGSMATSTAPVDEDEYQEIRVRASEFKVGDEVIPDKDRAGNGPSTYYVRRKVPPIVLPTREGRYLTKDGDVVKLSEDFNGDPQWSAHGVDLSERQVKDRSPLDFLAPMSEVKEALAFYGYSRTTLDGQFSGFGGSGGVAKSVF